MTMLERKKNEKIISRYYHRDDGKYHAIHCYVKKIIMRFPGSCRFGTRQTNGQTLQIMIGMKKKRTLDRRLGRCIN